MGEPNEREIFEKYRDEDIKGLTDYAAKYGMVKALELAAQKTATLQLVIDKYRKGEEGKEYIEALNKHIGNLEDEITVLCKAAERAIVGISAAITILNKAFPEGHYEAPLNECFVADLAECKTALTEAIKECRGAINI